MKKTPIEQEIILENKRYGTTIMFQKNTKPQNRIMLGIPTTGLVRFEWMASRYGQVVPCNWSIGEFHPYIEQISPLNFLVADARNLIVEHFIRNKFEWLVFIDSDVCIPPDFFVRVNDYLVEGKVPVFGGVYFTKSVPSEPLVYRGRGTGYYKKWKFGDKVWVDALGMGSTVIHRSILEEMHKDSPEYLAAGATIRKVFETPARIFLDPETGAISTAVGTEDIAWCDRVMESGYFKKAGWTEYQKKQYPFLIDTKIFSWHIDLDGNRFPMRGENVEYMKEKK